jgi:hypothetical protein
MKEGKLGCLEGDVLVSASLSHEYLGELADNFSVFGGATGQRGTNNVVASRTLAHLHSATSETICNAKKSPRACHPQLVDQFFQNVVRDSGFTPAAKVVMDRCQSHVNAAAFIAPIQ